MDHSLATPGGVSSQLGASRAGFAIDTPAADLQGAHEMQAHLQRTFLSIRTNLESSMDAMMRKMEDTAVRIEDVEKSLAEISSLTHLDDMPDLPPLPAP